MRYPTGKEIRNIRKWDILDKGVKGLLDLLESAWEPADWGFKLTGKRILKLELHTGGWSGNEKIIEALANNTMFWTMYWEKSVRGGHYYFRIYKPKGDRNE